MTTTMKRPRTLLAFLLCLLPIFAIGQTYKMYSTRNYHNQLQLNTATGAVTQIQDDGQSWVICNAMEENGKNPSRFCLYQTQNMWTFIMLDTYTGKNWQVQFSVKGADYMFATPINRWSCAYPTSSSNWTNRFQMYETRNMWTFIMLDTYNGRLWQVQYSSSDLNALLCVPINETELSTSSTRSKFSIQPMTSMYQYYLTNDDTGEMWQFQWTTKGPDYRWIKKVR